MILNDREIYNWATYRGGIFPYRYDCLNPASIDLTYSGHWIDADDKSGTIRYGDVTIYPRSLSVEIWNFFANILNRDLRKPTMVLATTNEIIKMFPDTAGEVKLKTTPTREGLGHPIADWIDPGYTGKLTLMLTANRVFTLEAFDKFCQLVIHQVILVEKPYGEHGVGHYMNQMKPTRSYREEEK